MIMARHRLAKPALGLLTERQIEVLRLRAQGYTQKRVAEQIRTTRENVVLIESRAKMNIERARATLDSLKHQGLAVTVEIPKGTHLVDIPRMILNRANRAKIKLGANFTRIYEDMRFKARQHVSGTRVTRPIVVTLFPDGDYSIE
jgi:Tfx family DNA-binding protein